MIALWLLGAALAGPLDESVDLLDQGQAAEAVTVLEAAASEVARPSAALHYNLGVAYLSAGDLPRAVGHLRAARIAYPRRGDVSHNLALARSGLEGVPEPVPVTPSWLGLLTGGELGLLGILLLLGTTLGAARAVQEQRAPWAWLPGWLLGAVVSWVAASGLGVLRDQPVLVVLDQEAVMRDVASVDGLERRRLAPGTEVQVERELGVFLLVSDSRGHRGWVPRGAGLLVGPDMGVKPAISALSTD